MKKIFETLLIEHCSPTLARVKTANLFCYPLDVGENLDEVAEQWKDRLQPYGIEILLIKTCCRKANCLVYVYRRNRLAADLEKEGVKGFLKQYGYGVCTSLDSYIEKLADRLGGAGAFPHEIGLFLGYPLEDVVGFVKHKGKNYCYSGCWKVYGDPSQMQKCFAQYEKCKTIYKGLHKKGRSVMQLTVPA